MDALVAMILHDLPPVGDPIVLSGEPATLPLFPGYRALWLNSGTAALALSLLLARLKRPEVDKPEVVVPSYCCPDLVSAAVYAGVQPVAVDIGDDDPGYDLELLQAALSENTIAVIAINFLGIAERLSELRNLLDAWPTVALIEDDAQWFPDQPGASGLTGDTVCLSFGRGKPVSLLGGGAMLVRDAYIRTNAVDTHVAPADEPELASRARMRAYNFALSPFCYGVFSRIPFLRLGRTAFKPLRQISAMDGQRMELLPSNIAHYTSRRSQTAERIHAALPVTMDLPARLGRRAGRLLRYPVLCRDIEQRDALLEELCREGLGASALYRRPLSEIDGVPGKLAVRQEMRGRSFAGRLLTLPVHGSVDARSLARMEKILNAAT